MSWTLHNCSPALRLRPSAHHPLSSRGIIIHNTVGTKVSGGFFLAAVVSSVSAGPGNLFPLAFVYHAEVYGHRLNMEHRAPKELD